jgi:hypothetical protein
MKFCQLGSTTQQIITAIENGITATRDISRYVHARSNNHVNEWDVVVSLSRLTKKGVLRRVSRGVYATVPGAIEQGTHMLESETAFPPWGRAPCTREQAKVLMALGAAKSSLTAVQVARLTGIKTAEVVKICEWACVRRIAYSLGDECRGCGEYYAASDVVTDYFVNGAET